MSKPDKLSTLYPPLYARQLAEAARLPAEVRVKRINQLTDKLADLGYCRGRSESGKFSARDRIRGVLA